MTKNILITGGAGFIGSHLAARCLSLGYNVTIIDNLSTGHIENIPQGANFIEMDVSNAEEYEKIYSLKFDAVFHLAAQSSGEVSQENPVHDCRVNTLSTLLLLEMCMKKGIRRFLYASSMAVYGNSTKNPVSECTNCCPLSIYGISKLNSESYINHYSCEEFHPTSFRMFSVYGPGQNMENLKQGMVSIFMAFIKNRDEIWVKGSKNRFRDFIYIDDVVDAWLAALDEPASYGQTYNLATGLKTTVGQLVEEELSAFGYNGKEYPVKYEGSTPYDQFGLYADISKIMHDLRWIPRVELSDGIKKMVKWVENN